MMRANESRDDRDLAQPRAAIERLPKLLDQAGTAPWAVAEAVGLSRDELRDLLVERSAHAWSPEGTALEGCQRVMAFLERFGSLDHRPRGVKTAAELARWLGQTTGMAPSLWSGLWLTAIDDEAGIHDEAGLSDRLRVDFVEDGRSLVVIWEWAGAGSPATTAARSTKREDLSRFCPPGTRIQLARIRTPLPVNPHVRGLYLKGELLASWA